ncbi:MAG: S-adenosylmethionine decarboxylase [Candidatus Nanopusillus sp.]|jgi:S-adenosylmethionine/arginine decarboxylase-like enzyme|nr:S-adenosylmethionine decarboxylase [Candidatus Nanopusillus sp.]
MNREYKKISVRDVKRLLTIVKISKNENFTDIIKEFSNDLAKILNSRLLYHKIYLFPADFEGNKDITFIGILTTSHIVISSYTEEDGIYIDIDAAWCSGENLNKEKFEELIKKYFKNYEIKSFKIYDYLGEESLLS